MATVLVRLFALLLGSFFLTASTSLQGLFLAVRGGAEGFPTFSLGMLGTTWAIGFVAGCILVPKLVARVGHIRSFGIMSTISAIIVLLNLLVIDPWFWVFTRAFTGFCMAGAFMVIESWLNERATSSNRGTIFGIYMVIVTLGYTTGQVGLGAMNILGFVPFIICAIGYSLALLPTALSTSAVPNPLAKTSIDIKAIQNASPVAAYTILLVGFANGAFGTLAPVYGQQIGLSAALIGFFMAGATVGGALSQLPFGKLSDMIDRRLVIVGVAIAATIVSIVFIITGGGEGRTALWLALAYGILIYPLYPVAVAHANDLAPEDSFTQTASTLLFIYGVGTMVGPIAASGLMEIMGPSGLFVFTAVSQAGIAIYAAYRMRQITHDLKDKASFQPIPISRAQTPESLALDPRHDDEPEVEEQALEDDDRVEDEEKPTGSTA